MLHREETMRNCNKNPVPDTDQVSHKAALFLWAPDVLQHSIRGH